MKFKDLYPGDKFVFVNTKDYSNAKFLKVKPTKGIDGVIEAVDLTEYYVQYMEDEQEAEVTIVNDQ